MEVLLDTHTLLWFLYGNDKLSLKAREIIESETNEVIVSIASLWEVTIKQAIGKLEIEGSLANFFDVVQANGFAIRQISADDLLVLATLPFHHRDPFDRILIAQALQAKIPILTKDAHINLYKATCLF